MYANQRGNSELFQSLPRSLYLGALLVAWISGCSGSSPDESNNESFEPNDGMSIGGSGGSVSGTGGQTTFGSGGTNTSGGADVTMTSSGGDLLGGTGGQDSGGVGGTVQGTGGTLLGTGGTLLETGGSPGAEPPASGGGGAMVPPGLPPVEGTLVSPPGEPVTVAGSSIQICDSGDSWVSLVSKNGIGCGTACASQGMTCRRSFEDQSGSCAPQPWELGCGETGQGSDFCACSSETFFQGKLYSEHPRENPPALETCQAGPGWASLVFHDGSGCTAACESVGLKCHTSFDDLPFECGPQASDAHERNCRSTSHASDFCVCTEDGSSVAGLPEIIVNPWRPF